jgi:hypothetical protein
MDLRRQTGQLDALEFGIERDGEVMVVPWGSDLKMVEKALQEIVRDAR